MFKKKEKVEFTQDKPQFCVRYVGHTETYIPSGKGCTQKPVQKMWDNAEEERRMRKVILTVTSNGILMKDVDHKKNVKNFDIKNITHCCAEQGAHDRIFSWIYKGEGTSYTCHAIISSHKEKAQAIAIVLSRAFHTAYVDWKIEKDKVARNKNKTQGSDAPPGRDSRSGSMSSGQSSFANGSPSSKGETAIDRCIAEMNITEPDHGRGTLTDNHMLPITGANNSRPQPATGEV